MDKKESLKILDKYTHALKAKAEAEEGLGKVDLPLELIRLIISSRSARSSRRSSDLSWL